jgi:tetratricopeptide (TPR) repeat protein
MARPDDPVLCGACGARNKAKWEFCARCGESLQGALPAAAPARVVDSSSTLPTKAAGKRALVIQTHAQEPSATDNFLAGASMLALVATLASAVVYACRSEPPPPPVPAGLTIPTQPPKPGAAVAPQGSSARKAFQEGYRLLSAGNAEEALPLLTQAVTEEAEQALFQWAYGEALIKTGDVDSGLAAQAEAARLDPTRHRLDYAKSLGVNQRRGEAVAEFEAILEDSPDDPEALRGAGWYLSQQGDFTRGLPLLRRAAEQRASDPSLLVSLAGMEAAGGNTQAAADAYWQAVQLQPTNLEARKALSGLLVQLGKPNDAVDLLKRGVSHSPGAGLQRDIGQMLEKLGRPGEAAAAYRDYARRSPDASDAQEWQQRADRLDPAGRTGS